MVGVMDSIQVTKETLRMRELCVPGLFPIFWAPGNEANPNSVTCWVQRSACISTKKTCTFSLHDCLRSQLYILLPMYTLTPSKYDVQIHSDHDLQYTCFPSLPTCIFGSASCLIVDHKHTSGGQSFSDKSIDYHLYFWFWKHYKHGIQIDRERVFKNTP